jgi:hypothetical protein
MLSSFIIISKNNNRKAEDDLNEECYTPNNLLKKYDISNPKCNDYNKNKEGSNINLKCFKKTYDTDEEKRKKLYYSKNKDQKKDRVMQELGNLS